MWYIVHVHITCSKSQNIIYEICQQFLISYSEITDGESLIGEKLIEVVHMFIHVYAYGTYIVLYQSF